MRRFLYACSITILFVACAGKPGVTANAWADATLVNDQRRTIEEQQSKLDELESAIESVHESIASARGNIERALSETKDLRELFAVIDEFVRGIIKIEQRLEALQQSNSNPDAGAR